MVSLRRGQHETRLEIMPLIDVIFLLLTFFIYAMVLMVRLDIVPMEVANFESDQAAEPVPAISISIDVDAQLFVGNETVEGVDEAVRLARNAYDQDDRTRIYVQVAKAQGEVDRLPIYMELRDRLMTAGLSVSIVSQAE